MFQETLISIRTALITQLSGCLKFNLCLLRFSCCINHYDLSLIFAAHLIWYCHVLFKRSLLLISNSRAPNVQAWRGMKSLLSASCKDLWKWLGYKKGLNVEDLQLLDHMPTWDILVGPCRCFKARVQVNLFHLPRNYPICYVLGFEHSKRKFLKFWLFFCFY